MPLIPPPLPAASLLDLLLLVRRVPAPVRSLVAFLLRQLIAGVPPAAAAKEMEIQAALAAWRAGMRNLPPSKPGDNWD